jgi:hypothetical protein
VLQGSIRPVVIFPETKVGDDGHFSPHLGLSKHMGEDRNAEIDIG